MMNLLYGLNPRIDRNMISGCLKPRGANIYPTQVIYFHDIFNFSYPEIKLAKYGEIVGATPPYETFLIKTKKQRCVF